MDFAALLNILDDSTESVQTGEVRHPDYLATAGLARLFTGFFPGLPNEVSFLFDADESTIYPTKSSRLMARVTKVDALRNAVIDEFREELRERYLAKNIRRFPELASIPGKTLSALREFILEHVYPVSTERAKLDSAFDSLGEIIHSPKRLMPLMTTAFRSVWRLGRMFPSAVTAGKNTLEAYVEVRRMEDVLLNYAQRRKLKPEQVADHDVKVRMFASIPEKEMTRFRNNMLGLLKHLADTKLLHATVEIMESSRGVMESRPDLYDEHELAGFSLGLDILQRGLKLFQFLDTDDVETIILGIEEVEIDWYHRIKAEAAELDAGA